MAVVGLFFAIMGCAVVFGRSFCHVTDEQSVQRSILFVITVKIIVPLNLVEGHQPVAKLKLSNHTAAFYTTNILSFGDNKCELLHQLRFYCVLVCCCCVPDAESIHCSLPPT